MSFVFNLMSLQNIKMEAPNTFFVSSNNNSIENRTKIFIHCYIFMKIYANTEIIYDAADFISTVIITGCK